MPANGIPSRLIEYVGSATSDFQAEPLLYDDEGRPQVFTDWELELTRRLQGRRSGIPNADIAALPEFRARSESYLNRSAELAENMVRLSLDFGRLCPDDQQFNEPLMKEHVKSWALARMRGQEPFVTLQHFTMPKFLVKTNPLGIITHGGWEHSHALEHFRFYVRSVIRFLADRRKIQDILAQLNMRPDDQDKIISEGLIRYFMTINEPTVLLFGGYVGGQFPPYRRGNLLAVRRLLGRLVQAHDIAWNEMKQGLQAQKCEPQIGVGHNWQYFESFLGKVGHWFQEHFVTSVERQGRHSDFMGLHYYFRWKGPLAASKKRRLDYGGHPSFGDVYPPGVRNVLAHANSLYPQKPIFITEFGFSDTDDLRRPYWILETVRHVLAARKAGIPVRAMLLWTLVSNFEWQFGMSQKFGLFSESQLNEPVVPSAQGIRSWEAWRTACVALASPTVGNLQDLQRCHGSAYLQYKEAGGRY